MITISLCMIVRDEEQVIGRCLDSIKDLVDEMIIVDTGSVDGTKDIVKAYTDKVYDFQWMNDFSAARNYAYSMATMDYILWLDADDVLLKEDRMKFRVLKETLDPTVDVVMMKYNVGFDEHGNTTLSYYRERLSKREKQFKWHEPIHEYLETSGVIINSDVAVTHRKEGAADPDRNLRIYADLLSRGTSLSPRGLYYYARELYYHGHYAAAIDYFNRFLNTEQGWVEDNISACYHLSICYYHQNDRPNMLKSLLKSFHYDLPRAEICCQMGFYYMDAGEYNKAIQWYKLATQLQEPANSWGFILHDYWGFIPNIQLCLCYYEIGDISEAIRHNMKASEFKPNDPAVLHNNEYFRRYLAKVAVE